MPRNPLGEIPFPPLVRINQDSALTLNQLRPVLERRPGGLSVCIRSEAGHENRGGYFFHLRAAAGHAGEYELLDFSSTVVTRLPLDKAVRFINHCSGRAFDSEMLLFVQNEINFRQDPTD